VSALSALAPQGEEALGFQVSCATRSAQIVVALLSPWVGYYSEKSGRKFANAKRAPKRSAHRQRIS